MLEYGFFSDDLTPVRFTRTEAWQFLAGSWRAIHPAEAHHKARILTEAQFLTMFDHLPPF